MKRQPEDDTIVCGACMWDGHVRYLEFEFRSLWYVCPTHGAQVTDEWLHERGYYAIT